MTPDEVARMKVSIAEANAKMHLMSDEAAGRLRHMIWYYEDKIKAAEQTNG